MQTSPQISAGMFFNEKAKTLPKPPCLLNGKAAVLPSLAGTHDNAQSHRGAEIGAAVIFLQAKGVGFFVKERA